MSEIPYTDTTQRYRLPHAEIPGCALVQDLIPLYLDGEVTPESHTLMANHLQQCERCSGYLAGARSVRSQILSEQQTIRMEQVKQPSVAQVREPLAGSLGMALWQSLMALLHAVGLFFGFLGAVGDLGGFPPLMIGAILVLAGLAGLMVVGSVRTLSWLVLMVLTSITGVFLTLLSLLGAPLLAVYGVGVIGLGAWGVWLHYVLQPGQTLQSILQKVRYGARPAMLTAFLSIAGIFVCGIIALVSLIIIMEAGELGQLVIGLFMLALSGGGILAISRRRGWFV